jgi:hypothetical protein
MNTITNLTQHVATADQSACGVVDFTAEQKQELVKLLTFTTIPNAGMIAYRAKALALLAMQAGNKHVMVGGAPYLMAKLEQELIGAGMVPLYSFTERVSEERPDGKGGVTKTNVFKHVGWVPARGLSLPEGWEEL